MAIQEGSAMVVVEGLEEGEERHTMTTETMIMDLPDAAILLGMLLHHTMIGKIVVGTETDAEATIAGIRAMMNLHHADQEIPIATIETEVTNLMEEHRESDAILTTTMI